MAYDAVIIGAGPAGSTTARLLAENGATVLLLDRHSFPRDKPCGGGVTLRAAAVAGIDLSPVIEHTIYGMRFSLRLGESFDRRFPQPLTYMTQRSHLDALLAQRAAEAGAAFHDDEAVRSVDLPSGQAESLTPGGVGQRRCQAESLTRGGVVVRTDKASYTAPILIGADGANGLVARATGLRPQFEEAVALEGNLAFSHGIPDDWKEYVGLDLGGLAGGYGWAFPKNEHLNLGVGAWKYAGFTLRPKLAQLSRRYGFDPDALTNLRGHHLPVRTSGTPIARGPVALVGDAAGLVDPFSGEGIHMAFASGRLAAESALAYLAGETASMASYQHAVDAQLQPELNAARKLQELFNFAPPPYLAVMRRSEKFWLFFCHLVRGERTYLDFLNAIGPLRRAVDIFASIAERRRLSRVGAGERLMATARNL